MRLKLTIAYDGSPFAGWQSQLHRNTAQDALEKAFTEIAHQKIVVHGAGRTDAGVHALAQCAHVDLENVSKKMSDPKRWLSALNSALPASLRILKIEQVPLTFHARFSAQSKTYRYLLWNDTVLPPLLHERAWLLHDSLDRTLLQQLATAITGTHDFRGFTARSRGISENTVRTIHAVKVTHRGKEIRLAFNGNGFLYHMVRMLVGAMVHVARGNGTYEDFLHRLHAAQSPTTPRTAPACGLYLVKIFYKQ